VSNGDHIATARDVYDSAASTYVQFVGTEISSATECPTDRSLLVAFIELIKRQAICRVADIGCGPGRVAAFMADHDLDVVGVDVSRAMLAIASTVHPNIEFQEGRLDALPIETGVLAGAVCWYSIIYTPPDRLDAAFDELARVLISGGYLLLAFQTEGEPVHREGAFGTHLPLTSYRHSMREVIGHLESTGFKTYTTAIRAPELEHETTSQGFVIATGPTHSR
jgi:ubiquinone/menaquinone biosynthesis C-methylase UbiE